MRRQLGPKLDIRLKGLASGWRSPPTLRSFHLLANTEFRELGTCAAQSEGSAQTPLAFPGNEGSDQLRALDMVVREARLSSVTFQAERKRRTMRNSRSSRIKIATISITCLLSFNAHAGTSSEELGTCFVESTSGKDRVTLVRWIFNTIAMNPRVKDIANVTLKSREDSSKEMALLYERLVFSDCKQETKIAVREDGLASLEHGFKRLGEIAVNELMVDPAVQNEIRGLEKYLDISKWNALSAEGSN